MSNSVLRLLVLGAHPDDAEYHAGGLTSIYREQGHRVRIISVTDGRAGHHEIPPSDVADIRRKELSEAGDVIGAVSEAWDFPDGQLMPTLEVRHRIIHEIRSFAPDLVLTHRTNDYHPDHRAVGQAVQDASFLVTVPHVVPETPALRKEPVIAYMVDLFTKPCPMRADVVLDITDRLDTIVTMLAKHRSQVYEWLPYLEGTLDQVPQEDSDKIPWLREWYGRQIEPRADRFREALISTYGESRGRSIRHIEAFEFSEYSLKVTEAIRAKLFPQANVS